jgi:hypothetical protein
MTPTTTTTVTAGTATAITATPSTGYVFSGWSANPATNAVFANASSASTTVTLSGNATITPTFTLTTYTVTYNGNNAPNGNPPVDSNHYLQGATVTVLGAGSLTSAYSLAGWNTMADGTGTSYAINATFTIGSSDVVLYAIWIPTYFGFTASGNNIVLTSCATTDTGSISVPGGVTSIGASAFTGCASLTNIIIPSSVTSIGNSAFYGCSGLTTINIPSGVTSIGNSAFYGCSGLTTINIPSGVTSIGPNAFYNCAGLTSITIPSGVATISAGISLASVTISAGVTSIDGLAFYGCPKLTSVTIPSSVTSIAQDAFNTCQGLVSIIEQATTPPSLSSSSFVYVGNGFEILVPYSSDGSILAAYKAATGWSAYASEIFSQ